MATGLASSGSAAQRSTLRPGAIVNFLMANWPSLEAGAISFSGGRNWAARAPLGKMRIKPAKTSAGNKEVSRRTHRSRTALVCSMLAAIVGGGGKRNQGARSEERGAWAAWFLRVRF